MSSQRQLIKTANKTPKTFPSLTDPISMELRNTYMDMGMAPRLTEYN